MIEQKGFNDVFTKTVPLALHNVAESQYRKLDVSIHGKGIIQVSKILSEDYAKVKKVTEFLSLPYYGVFNNSNRQDLNIKEAIFMSFHNMSQEILPSLIDIVTENIEERLPFRQFCATFLHQILKDLIASRSELYKKEISKSPELSEKEQQVLFYISGFLICALQKQLKRLKASEKEALIVGLEHMQLNKSNTEKTMSQKFSNWTNKLDRGGLKIPSDDMFFLVREIENQYRQQVSENQLATETLNLEILKETIMDKFMVKYYTEKLVPGKFSSHILERILSIFMTIRGNAVARKKKQELCSTNEKKALRKVLKEKFSN